METTKEEQIMKDVTIPFIYHVAFNIVAMVVVAIGILGNILNLIVLTRPKLKGVMYVYLLGLAVSNLFVLFTAIPALMSIAKSPEPMYSQTYALTFFFAHLEIPLLNAFMAASVYIIIGMTVNRYISIYKPTHFQRIHTFKNAYLAIAASFLFGALLHVPLAFQDYVYESCVDVGNEVTCPKYNETDDPGGGRSKGSFNLDSVKDGIHCSQKTYVVCSNNAYTQSLIFVVYTYFSESLLRFGPIITLTILNILIIARFNRIVRRREVLKGNNAAASITGRNGNNRKITSSSTSGTTSSGNNNTSASRNNSSIYAGIDVNGYSSNKKAVNRSNAEKENGIMAVATALAKNHVNGGSMHNVSQKEAAPMNDEAVTNCWGCIQKIPSSRKGSDANTKDRRRSTLVIEDTTEDKGKNCGDTSRRTSSNRYLMTPDQVVGGKNK